MSIPETTSAEAFERYVGGKTLAISHGEAWRDVKAWLGALPPVTDALQLPSDSEPFLALITSGEVDFQEREAGQSWVTHRLRKGSFFLTSGGAPYECRWKAVTPEPFESMAVFLELPLLQRALVNPRFNTNSAIPLFCKNRAFPNRFSCFFSFPCLRTRFRAISRQV